MTKNVLIELEKLGQSIWLDYISRTLLDSGELLKLIKNDHLKGVTSNPSIFEKAIAKTEDYAEAIESLGRKDAKNAQDLYENLAIKDIQDAADLLRSTYEETKACDGFACLEVSPHLAFDTKATIEEARRLFYQVDRPNLMVKVPGTKEGMAAIRTLISDGINVNVTLLFAVDAYKEAAMAHLLGLKDRTERGLPIDQVQGVASFFISRIDEKIDPKLSHIIEHSKDPEAVKMAEELYGKIAIANAKVAYANFQEIYQSDLAKSLSRKGAHPQRLLWASTGTKNSSFSDVLYVESLIGPHTVNTLPQKTLQAFLDHGKVTPSLTLNMNGAEKDLKNLAHLDIDFAKDCQELLAAGIELFTHSFDELLRVVDAKLRAIKSQNHRVEN